MVRRRGHRFWRLLVTTTVQPTGAPLVDSCSTTAVDHEGEVNEERRYFGGYAIRVPWSAPMAVVVGWDDAHPPVLSRRALARWVRFRLGIPARPTGPPMGVCNDAESTRPT